MEKEQSRNVFDAVSVVAWPFIFASWAFDGALCCCCVGRLSLMLNLSRPLRVSMGVYSVC
jgi:hypothetical protein